MIFIIIAIIAVLVLWGVTAYNGLVKSRMQTKESWSQIDVQLKRRNDLIPNLIETVKVFWLNAISMVVALVILYFASCFVPELQQRGRLLLIGSFKLIANLFWIEWFYRGLENFRYITIRSIIVRLLFVASVFIFVRDEGDFDI